MLLEKYEPKSLDEFLGNKKQLEDIIDAVKKNKNIVLSGPSGTGKNLAIKLIADKMGYEVSEVYNIEDLQRSQQRSLFFKGRIIVIDADEVNNIGKITSFKTRWPIIFLCENPYDRKFLSLRKFDIIKFYKVRADTIEKFLINVCEKEGIKYERSAITQLSWMCEGDVRSALIDLEQLNEVTMSNVKKLDEREQVRNVFETLKILFNSRNIQNTKLALDSSDKPIEELLWWLEENLSKIQDPEELANCFEYLAKADLFRVRIVKRQAWTLQKYLPIAFYGLIKNNSKIFMFSPPSLMKRMNTNKENSDIIEEISKVAHCSKSKAWAYSDLVNVRIGNKD